MRICSGRDGTAHGACYEKAHGACYAQAYKQGARHCLVQALVICPHRMLTYVFLDRGGRGRGGRLCAGLSSATAAGDRPARTTTRTILCAFQSYTGDAQRAPPSALVRLLASCRIASTCLVPALYAHDAQRHKEALPSSNTRRTLKSEGVHAAIGLLLQMAGRSLNDGGEMVSRHS